jgi:lysophospholipase
MLIVPASETALSSKIGEFLGLSVKWRTTSGAHDGYAPESGVCISSKPTIRNANGLSINETSWLELRSNNTLEPMHDLLIRLNISGFNASAYISGLTKNISALPKIAIAFSGGGWRALMNGAGALQAFDSRTSNSTSAGQLGGVLQASTYMAGLSGGSWLVGSVAANNFSTVSTLLGGPLWAFENSILQGPAALRTAEYYGQIQEDVSSKRDAGFEVTITDYW